MGIYGQRFAQNGTKVGEEFRVNTSTDFDQKQPAITALADGGFVVAWESDCANGDEDNGDDWVRDDNIFAQRFNSDGGKEGGEFQVNTFAKETQKDCSITALSEKDGGGFIISWESFVNNGQERESFYAQRFDKDGKKVEGEFRLKPKAEYLNGNCTIVALKGENGGFVATWSENRGDNPDIYCKRFTSQGQGIGEEFKVNSDTSGEHSTPSIAVLEDGGFVITWDADEQDGSSTGVFGQRFDQAGGKIGKEFHINTHTKGHQESCSITALKDGGFVVAWTSDGGADGSDEDIYAQRFASDGSKAGMEFLVNTHTDSVQRFSSITALEDGGFVIAWESYDQDGSDYGVYARRFDKDGNPLSVSSSNASSSDAGNEPRKKNLFADNAAGATIDADDRAFYTTTGALFDDINGLKDGTAVEFASLDDKPQELKATDFVVFAS